MLFVFSSGHKTLTSPVSSSVACPACRIKGACVVTVDYDYSAMFQIFRGLKNEVVTLNCKSCMNGRELDPKARRQLFSKDARDPVPFMDRYGAHVLIILLVAWVAFAFAFPCLVNPYSDACHDSR